MKASLIKGYDTGDSQDEEMSQGEGDDDLVCVVCNDAGNPDQVGVKCVNTTSCKFNKII